MKQHYFIYPETSLHSGILAEYAPQTVTVFDESENGWIKITTDHGLKWTPLKRNKYTLIKTLLPLIDRQEQDTWLVNIPLKL